MQKLVLGTAQLGMNYGINNEDGKPSKTESFKILDYAYNENIKMVDTALAYGDSEKVIGDYKNSFKICSKMPSLSNMNNGDIEKTFNKSLNNLKVETIDYYLIHDFQDALKQDVIHFLKKYKKEGIINNTGVSVYEPEEADKIINTGLYDSIQIPLNILDTRFLQKGLLSNKNITIFIRSIFLQGLLFLDYDKTPENLSEASSYLKKINDFCDDHNVNLVNLIFSWYQHNGYGDYILIGVDNLKQLKENIKYYNIEVPSNILKKFNDLIKSFQIPDNSVFIDPRKW